MDDFGICGPIVDLQIPPDELDLQLLFTSEYEALCVREPWCDLGHDSSFLESGCLMPNGIALSCDAVIRFSTGDDHGSRDASVPIATVPITAEAQRLARRHRRRMLDNIRRDSKTLEVASLPVESPIQKSRGVTVSCGSSEGRLRRSTLRNRENARRARERVKTLMQDLEQRLQFLERENAELRERVLHKRSRPRMRPFTAR
mmetsp:Transcript_9359/g.16121  ORF Transcript_9359/g.16121 Transcript_9359/m.16121 type:complete len:202 (-) Transcript_9359:318-923(-)|eukprot:CAMPEP_0196662890 /NCGR_PEP_ID=MMETSP1086-20130531/50716_1 /TAXON_ID=77921 /ORGANISM="Cyanoptyche  gloeocystis , Strain SAG4.97" /LENGTH=201 /DNA_ID=CAMNT_0041998509 /DNA_START=82 /DNA_END=687 /DNA_ORIENTATION=+